MDIKTKYYVEFESTESENKYSIQSKYFDTEQEAIQWYKDSFDFVDINEIIVSIMKAEMEEDENGDDMLIDIYYLYDITAKYCLKGK